MHGALPGAEARDAAAAALESVFAARRLSAPWALCPSTTEADVVREWLTWASVGMEGVVFKRLDGAYKPSVRGWEKYKVRETSEAIVFAIATSRFAPNAIRTVTSDSGRSSAGITQACSRPVKSCSKSVDPAITGELPEERGAHQRLRQ